MPDNKGRFHLYSDTSIIATGSVLYQIQNRQLRLIAYAIKGKLSATQNDSITELELCWFCINKASFSSLIRGIWFWCGSGSFSSDAYHEK